MERGAFPKAGTTVSHSLLPLPHRSRPSGSTAAPAPARRRRLVLRGLSLEAVLLLVLLGLYRWGRALADGRHPLALAHAHRLRALEQHLHLPDELAVQHVLLAHPLLARAADTYYATVHFPLTGAALVFLYLRRRRVYRRARTTLVLATGAGLLTTFGYPLAPPRMLGDLGFTDVAARFGQSVYQGAAAATSNQFAAMPSLHVGWAVLVALALSATAPGETPRHRWVRRLWWAHPVTTLLVVIGTGNHFWLDGVAGTALVLTGWGLARRVPRRTPRPATAGTVVPRPRRSAGANGHPDGVPAVSPAGGRSPARPRTRGWRRPRAAPPRRARG